MSINTFFILASSSKSRRNILNKLRLNFKTVRPKCDEQIYRKKFKKLKITPTKISKELAKIKALDVSNKIRNSLVVGSDTVIDFKGKIIEKAKNIISAQKKLTKLSGQKHIIISSIAVYYNKRLVWLKTEKATVKIRTLNILEIKKYLKNCGPSILESVGCYQVEKKGPHIIEYIKGDFFNVMGFPIFDFIKFLKDLDTKGLKKVNEK